MRLAETPPVCCAACGLQRPDRAHVDFEAAWDGPVVQDGLAGFDGETLHNIPTPVDDLVLCDQCLTAAGQLIGLETVDEDRYARLETQAEELRRELETAGRHIAEQDRTLKSRDSFGRQAPGRKPKPKGPREPVAA